MLIKLLVLLFVFFLKNNADGFNIIVTSNPICTDMAKYYITRYPKISTPELFIITSVCDGIVNPMESGLGGGFQMVIFTSKSKSGHYINSRETSGAIVPTSSGQNAQNIGVPSMLAGYQYIYNNLKKWGLQAAVPWHELFTENIELAIKGFAISDTLKLVLSKTNTVSIWKISRNILKNLVLSNYLIHIARHGPNKQPIYINGTYANQMISRELKSIGSFITGEDVSTYRVIEKEALKITCFNYTVYTSSTPGSGFLQLFGCRLLEEAVMKYEYLSWQAEHQFIYNMRINYYMYSLGPHIKSFTVSDMKLILSRDVIFLAEFIITKLDNRLPTKISTDIGSTKLPLSRVINSHSVEYGTSNICLSNKESHLCATSTINWAFGSGLYSKYFGFFYNNQLSDFTYNNINNPNKPKPYTHPQSSMSPTIFIDRYSNKLEFAAGAAGGKKIISATFAVLSSLILQKLKFKEYNCTEAQLVPRCIFHLIPNNKNVQMRLDCENHLDRKFKILLNKMKIGARYSVAAGYSAATSIVKNKAGCHDPRRGGKGIYIRY